MGNDSTCALLWPKSWPVNQGLRELEDGERIMVLAIDGVTYEVLYRLESDSGMGGESGRDCPHCLRPIMVERSGAQSIRLLDVLVLCSGTDAPRYQVGEPIGRLFLDGDPLEQRIQEELLLGHLLCRRGCLTDGCPGALNRVEADERKFALLFEGVTHG